MQGKIERGLKSKVMSEVNTHVQRQFKIDQVMRNRYDEKANKMFFGTNFNKKKVLNKDG